MTALWLVVQSLGLAAVVAGAFLVAGLGVALMVGGALAAAVAEMRT